MSDTEIEIQVRIQNSKDLKAFLEKSAKFLSEKYQIDEYFTPNRKNFVATRPIKEWLRLRNSNGKYFITYKNWYYDKNGKNQSYCDEYETIIENLEQLRKILIALDFKPLVIVDKLRKTWVYKNYEISLDVVRGLGDFVEIEHIGKDKKLKPEKMTKEMINFLKEHKCGKIERNYVGYPFQLLFPEEVHHEKQ